MASVGLGINKAGNPPRGGGGARKHWAPFTFYDRGGVGETAVEEGVSVMEFCPLPSAKREVVCMCFFFFLLCATEAYSTL